MERTIFDVKNATSSETASKILDLNDLRVFAYVAMVNSFSGAGEMLNMHKSSVSRSISRLEDALDSQLIHRSTRSKVRLTLAGVALKDRCNEFLTRVGETVGYVGNINAEPQGHISVCIAATLGLADRVQTELLPDFLAHHQKVKITLRLASRMADLKSDSVDVALFIGELFSPMVPSGKIGVVERVLCAAPEYIRRRGQPSTLLDLSGHDVIFNDDGESAPASNFGNPVDLLLFRFANSRLSVNEPRAVQQLVLGGAGIGCLMDHLCREDIQSGRIVRLLPDLPIAAAEIGIAFPSKRHLSPAVKSFIELLKSAYFTDDRGK